MIGHVGLVLKTIDSDVAGQVQVNGEVWRAVAEEIIQEHEKVTILKVTGTTVIVEKKK